MSDLRSDGTRLYARVTWRIAGGPVIDPRKIMLVDTGAPHTSINRANLHPGLIILGIGLARVLDRRGECLILGGGEMSLDLGGGDIRKCSWPVWYCPNINDDTLGLDQYTAMGLIPGVDPRTPPSGVGVVSTLAPGIAIGGMGGLEVVDSIFGTPSAGAVFDTPSPGLFGFLSPQIPQGGFAAGEWAYAHAWPRSVPPGAVFEVALELQASAPFEFVVIAHELPAGFGLVDGEAATTLFDVGAGSIHRRTLRVRASGHPGDHFWQTIVRVPGEPEPVRVAGRVVVRP